MVFVFCFLFLLPSFYNSSYFILLERRVGASFTELFFASIASLKNLKIDGKLFQEVSSWRSVPAKYKGDSLTGGGVSLCCCLGTGTTTYLQTHRHKCSHRGFRSETLNVSWAQASETPKHSAKQNFVETPHLSGAA